MTMGVVKRDKGVVKLVHPGGFVEIHNQPITAAEVMKKNPRHCVTRTDVFKFPWIVVHPESVLKLGSIFYIVPNHTIHHLLQTYDGPQCQASSIRQRQSSKKHDHYHHLKQKSRAESWAEVTSKYEEDDRRHLKQRTPISYWLGFTPELQIHDRRLNQQFPLNSWDKITPQHDKYCNPVTKKQDHNKQFKKRSTFDSSVEVRSSHAKIPTKLDSSDDARPSHAKIPTVRPSHAKIRTKLDSSVNVRPSHAKIPTKQDVLPALKSCFSKKGSYRKSLGLRVQFALPGEKDRESCRKRVSTPRAN